MARNAFPDRIRRTLGGIGRPGAHPRIEWPGILCHFRAPQPTWHPPVSELGRTCIPWIENPCSRLGSSQAPCSEGMPPQHGPMMAGGAEPTRPGKDLARKDCPRSARRLDKRIRAQRRPTRRDPTSRRRSLRLPPHPIRSISRPSIARSTGIAVAHPWPLVRGFAI